ncbi:MAG: DUF763 domain-containing protein [Acidobacteriota bacterium]
MAQRSGSADLPLHTGRVPPWLARRMERLGRVIVEAVILHYGRDEFLRRLAHPFWFQSFGAVMGMDWHSSGITTSVVGALKRGLAPLEHELGLRVCGGRGRHSRKTPSELLAVSERVGLDGNDLARTSRLVAKVDSAAVQDGFDIYLHSFVIADDGAWVVIQQGMKPAERQARRYHWLSEGLNDFLDAPHAAIDGPRQGEILNLTDTRAAPSRDAQVELIQQGPESVTGTLRQLRGDANRSLFDLDAGPRPHLTRPHLTMPAHHDVRISDVQLRRLASNLAAAADRGPVDFPDLLLMPGIGARTVEALSLVSEVVHGTPTRFSDPARFSMAHGGKDGQPFPVPVDVFDHTLTTLRQAVDAARLGNDDRLQALERLDRQARQLEQHVELEGQPAQGFDAFLETERRRSPDYGGRTVFGPAGRPRPRKPRRTAPSKPKRRNNRQLVLPGLGTGSRS